MLRGFNIPWTVCNNGIALNYTFINGINPSNKLEFTWNICNNEIGFINLLNILLKIGYYLI